MARIYDWLSKNHETFHGMVTLMVAYMAVALNRVQMHLQNNTPDGEWYDTVLLPAINTYFDKYDLWVNPEERTKAKNIAFFAAETNLKPLYRKWYRILKESPYVDNENLVRMNFPERPSGIRHRNTPPSDIPNARVTHAAQAVLRFDFYNTETGRRAKPYGVRGVEVVYALLDAPPTSIDELAHSRVSTRSPYILTFDFSLIGQSVYFAMRYENTIGEKGPWSPIYTVAIS
jgi:hypothetical protein